jgi:hypothetical protein
MTFSLNPPITTRFHSFQLQTLLFSKMNFIIIIELGWNSILPYLMHYIHFKIIILKLKLS